MDEEVVGVGGRSRGKGRRRRQAEMAMAMALTNYTPETKITKQLMDRQLIHKTNITVCMPTNKSLWWLRVCLAGRRRGWKMESRRCMFLVLTRQHRFVHPRGRGSSAVVSWSQ